MRLNSINQAGARGEKAKQDRIRAERKKAAAEQQKVRNEFTATKKWVSNALAPVVVELHNDLVAVGSVGIADVGRPPIVARDTSRSEPRAP
jgi:hypothetical protein